MDKNRYQSPMSRNAMVDFLSFGYGLDVPFSEIDDEYEIRLDNLMRINRCYADLTGRNFNYGRNDFSIE